jgi:coenzyme F420-reducing hydrogenase gamma subunit
VLALLLTAVLLGQAERPPSTCDARCHQQGSECLKSCSGDPKDAQRPDQGQHLMRCLQGCEQRTRACKQQCPRKDAPPPKP